MCFLFKLYFHNIINYVKRFYFCYIEQFRYIEVFGYSLVKLALKITKFYIVKFIDHIYFYQKNIAIIKIEKIDMNGAGEMYVSHY